MTRRRRVQSGLEGGAVVNARAADRAGRRGDDRAVAIVNADRGLPLAALILIGFVVLFQYITSRTRFGRHIYAVGGNAEAARRAGINVNRVRVVVFMLARAWPPSAGSWRPRACSRSTSPPAAATCCCSRSPGP